MIFHRIIRLLLVPALALLPGCTVSHYHLGEPVGQWPDQQAGEPSLSNILAQLGPPLHVSSHSGGYWLAWEYWEIEERKLGLSLRPVGADFLSIDLGKANTSGEFLLLAFDRQHRLVDSRLERWQFDAGSGRGVQALVSLMPVVDVGDLTHALPQHRWGAFAWSELPVGLNRPQHMSTGESGLERRGTPSGAGQESTQLGRGH